MANASGNAPLSVTLSLVDKATAPLRKFNESMQKLAAPAKSLKNHLKLRAAEIGLPKVGEAFKGVGKAAGGVVKQVRALGKEFAVLAGLGAGFLGGMVFSTANAVDTAYKTAQKVGIATESWSKLSYAADMSGVSMEELRTGLSKLNSQTIKWAQGNKETRYWFGRLGVEMTDQAGKLKTSDALLGDLAAKFAAMPEGAAKAGMAAKIFGEDLGPKLLPFLNAGREGIAALGAEAERLGIVFTDDQGRAAEAFNDSMARMRKSIQGVFYALGNQLIPIVEPFFKRIQAFFEENRTGIATTLELWLGRIQKVADAFGGWSRVIPVIVGGLAALKLAPLVLSVVTLGKSILGVGWALTMTGGKLLAFLRVHRLLLGGLKLAGQTIWGIGGAFKAVLVPAAQGLLSFGKGAALVGKILGGMLVKALFAVGGAIKAVGVAFLSTPIGWIALGVAALVGVFIYLWKNCEGFRNFWIEMWNRVTGYVSDAVGNIKAAFGEGILNGLATAFAKLNPLRLFVEALDSVVEYLTGFSLMDAGERLMRSLWDGLKNVWGSVTAWVMESVNSLTGWMPEWMRDKLGLNVSVADAQGSASPDAASSPYGPPAGVHDMIRKDSVSRSESVRDAKVTVEFQNMPAGAGVKTKNVDQTKVYTSPDDYAYNGFRMGF